MEEREASSLLLFAFAFLVGFVLSLFRSEYIFAIISLVFSILVYCIGFILAMHNDSKDLSRQFEN